MISVSGNTVNVIGVNPPTGKHITFELPGIKSIADIPIFVAAMHSGTFFKVLGSNIDEDVHLEQEAPVPSATDSYFTLVTYCINAGYNPLFLRELQVHTLVMDSATTLNRIGLHVLNAIEKLGNIFFAINAVTVLNRQMYQYRQIRYHVFNTIVSCKACFDALASILNEVYSTGYTKGKIDLATNRSNLLTEISVINPVLGKKLKQYEGWINSTTEYRDFIIHRMMIITPPMGTNASDSKARRVRCTVPARPIGVNDSDKGVDLIDAEDFCRNLSTKLIEVIEIVCQDLLQQIEAGRYFPGMT